MNLEEIEKNGEEKIEQLKIAAGTIRRTVGMIITGILQIISVAAGQEIMVNEGFINNIVGYVSIGLTIGLVIYQLWCSWKNNSYTQKALLADLIAKDLSEEKEVADV